jgi:tRNA(Ile)-lysidine synthetase-like protein
VQRLAQTVLEYIREHELLKAGDRVGIAVSGGADSVALLRLLLELRKEIGIVLSAVHFNHKLRGVESEEDERFVAELARQHKLELLHEGGDVAAHAAEKHVSLETAAREMRYRYFRHLLTQGCLSRIATAHTLDDQAETVLLKIVRGAGSRGLAGIYPQLPVLSSRMTSNLRSFARCLESGEERLRPICIRWARVGVRTRVIEICATCAIECGTGSCPAWSAI